MTSAGAEAVILLPPMNDDAAGRAVDITTSWTRDSSGAVSGPTAVLVLVAELRRLVDTEADVKVPALGPTDDVVAFVRTFTAQRGTSS